MATDQQGRLVAPGRIRGCILRGCAVGDNAVIATNAVVTNDVPAKRGGG